MTAASDLDALVGLQDLDTHIDQERHHRAHLPERAELAEIQRSEAEVQSARKEIAALLEEVAGRQSAAERELKATEERIRQVNERLFRGGVPSRDLSAMSADVEGLRKRASELEDKVLLLMEQREPLDSSIAGSDKALLELAARKAEVTSRLAVAEAQVDEVLSTLEARRQAAASAVSANVLSAYEKLKARLGGVAVARLVGGRCSGCHLTLPAVELDRIRHEPPGTLEHCEQCGRILVIAAQ